MRAPDACFLTFVKVEQVVVFIGLLRAQQILLIHGIRLQTLGECVQRRNLSRRIALPSPQPVPLHLSLFQLHSRPFVVRILVAGLVAHWRKCFGGDRSLRFRDLLFHLLYQSVGGRKAIPQFGAFELEF